MIDVHTHFMLPEHWGDEFTTNWKPVHGFDWPVIKPDDYDQAMAPVETAIVFGIRATAAGVGVPNEAIAEFCRPSNPMIRRGGRHLQGRIHPSLV